MSDNAARDQNRVTTLLAVSSVDGTSVVALYADPDTHRLLVEATAGVVGGLSSTDNAIVRWDGTTALTVQNSGVIIDDSNNVTGVAIMNATTYKAGGTSPVADGTYTVGNRITPVTGALGTITVKGGIITAIQEAT
jgi:hypothetical protein